MTHRLRRAAVVKMFVCLVAIACGVASVSAHALTARSRPVAHPAAGKAATVSIVNHIFGSDGAKGTFTAKLGSAARVVAALLSAATGVPYGEIAKGGTFKAKVAASKGGTAVVTFSDHALGKACVKWSGTSGKYDPSKGYLPVDGSLKMVGGTGAAAHWRGSLTFKQTGLTGTDTLQFSALVHGSRGAGHGMTAACRAVTRLKG
jgi:hypothetical protein